MNIRKNIDYRDMYAALNHAMASEMEQMELYCAIGKAVSLRPEKGAAVAAAKYLTERYPDAHGFSPRNVRRMRDFYRAYENHPALLTLAVQIGWTQNVVILEADLPMELREWYLWAAKQFGWSKVELTKNLEDNAHEKIVLAIGNDLCYSEGWENKTTANNSHETFDIEKEIQNLIQRCKYLCSPKEGSRRRWPGEAGCFHTKILRRHVQLKVKRNRTCIDGISLSKIEIEYDSQRNGFRCGIIIFELGILRTFAFKSSDARSERPPLRASAFCKNI